MSNVSSIPSDKQPPEVCDPSQQTGAVPELLAPAGDWECARAAVENGADAIYFGLNRFNARMRANNFTDADLPKLMEFLHSRSVKGYVTLNTLVFENELAQAEQYLRAMIVAGVDAVIVQDVGVCQLVRSLSSDFPIHASTQMTVTSAEGVRFARQLGCNLVVLARECSLREIEKIQSAVGGLSPLPLEVFVHGALCVAYSGQCLTSEALGGRSANRGECAQACRMPYELIADGKLVPLDDRRYLLSPQDLSGLEVLPELVRLGVTSLKIEGRLKTPEYVANVTRAYRQALDSIRNIPRLGNRESSSPSASSVTVRYELEMAFSRGLFTGWFRGVDNQRLVHARFGKKRGVYLGSVGQVLRDRIVMDLAAPLRPGDGVVFDCGRPDEKEEGGRVYAVDPYGKAFRLAFGAGDIDFARVHPGDKVWKTSDPELNRELRASFAGNAPRFRRPVNLEVHGIVGRPLVLIVRDDTGHVVETSSSMNLTAATAHPLTTERLEQQLGRLGGTPFVLGEVKNQLLGEVILPVSELNRMRRDWVAALQAARSRPKRWELAENPTPGPETSISRAVQDPQLAVLVRSFPQLEAALECDVQTIYCDFEDPKKYRLAVEQFRAWQRQRAQRNLPLTLPPAASANEAAIFVAPPRIFKMGEDWILKQVKSSEADGYLVRNYDHLEFFAGCRCVGDYSFNIANSWSAAYFKKTYGLERITASYDLNSSQLEALLSRVPGDWFDVTVHQHMPMFHMEHCVFCAFLSQGTDYTNCGRPCDRHALHLADRVGARHAVKADSGCRNTVFNALAQTGAEHLEKLRQLGVRSFRLEFVDELKATVMETILQYRKVLSGEMSGSALWRELKLLNQLGVTRGQVSKADRAVPH